ncbi:NADPH-dependent assimilatory sulfite reductase hemoprotein subunit [Oscillatoria amoena NRMC-F 0135]|nr:NADPH-dependent assimilatory sulfite reductase hemoprotein subunit [Oscillatoria laete-virens]MDL5046529.1 NADPH-dependent assimilatory sulfite reductase hemoprotein subunit [Oscillatoria amoena NRMC-F 0135]MDL5054856.1 NADPH-dependent assimilatory sulfite reductase hemoprotein subunit [Oscillatoria laete-virens NRMC-F 0139]
MSKSPVEEIKDKSNYLRGTLAETLADTTKTHFSEEEYQLLKFHGSYQQDDRDQRAALKREGKDKAWSFMLRTKTPGGAMTAAQYIVHDKLADDLANGTMRLTTRQGIQFHGILKGDFKECVQRIYNSGVTTLGACGDVVRNTMGPSAPIKDDAHVECLKFANQISDHFLPRSGAYAEIWLDGEKIDLSGKNPEEVEPIYGKHYLPRKFKIGIVIPPRNDVDIYTQDIGFIAHVEGGKLRGYNITVGGGFGMAHGNTATRPCLGQPLFYVAKEHALEACEAIVTFQRDHGNRADRKLARFKYVVLDKGIEFVREGVKSRMKSPVEPFKSVTFTTVSDALGWHEQGDGKLFVGVHVAQGRIKDSDGINYKSAFIQLAREISCPMMLTPNCNIIFHDITPEQKPLVEKILADHGVPSSEGFTEARKVGHACVALPTCGLSLAESERVFTSVLDEIDAVLKDLGLEKEPLLFRMTGCPNGCARPYNADFAFVGRAPNKYAFYVGGASRGDRLAGLEKKSLDRKDIASTVRGYLEDFKAHRQPGESFTDYWGRTKVSGPAPHIDQFHYELKERAERLAAAKAVPAE